MINITQHIQKAKRIHGNWYDYSKITDSNIRYTDKVTIICPVHGEFQQTLNSHHRGSGCPDCGRLKHTKKRISDIKQQLNKCKKIHNNKYDYSLVTENVRALEKISIICPEHGLFNQRLNDHYNGHGCPLCGSEQRATSNQTNREQANEKRRKTNFKRYGGDYNQQHISSYALECLNNKEWLYNQHYIKQNSLTFISNHLNVSDRLVGIYMEKHGFEVRKFAVSDQEKQLQKFIKQLNVNHVNNTRKVISPYELDIFIPEYNIAIEYCGLYWHSESQGKHRSYHKRKYDMCSKQGIQLITIFEDEWLNKPEIVKSKIKTTLQRNNSNKTYARNTTVVPVSKDEKHKFYEQNHIQGDGPGSITYGLVYKQDLVACCSFCKKGGNDYYLTRYATKHNVVGGFSKLINHFTKHHNYDQIVSFADLRWSNGNLYTQTGWQLDTIIPPDYYYVINGNERKHKFGFRRKHLAKKLPHFNPNLSEKQNCDINGLLRIWDCGKMRFILTQK